MHKYSLIEKIRFNVLGFVEISILLILPMLFVVYEYLSPLIIIILGMK